MVIIIKYSIPVSYLKLYLTYYSNQNYNNTLLNSDSFQSL